jgi:hypothetical protein
VELSRTPAAFSNHDGGEKKAVAELVILLPLLLYCQLTLVVVPVEYPEGKNRKHY